MKSKNALAMKSKDAVMKKTILLTGAAGSVGLEALRELVRRPIKRTCCANLILIAPGSATIANRSSTSSAMPDLRRRGER